MSLQKSVPKNKTIYFNNLQSQTTGSIPVSSPFFQNKNHKEKILLFIIFYTL